MANDNKKTEQLTDAELKAEFLKPIDDLFVNDWQPVSVVKFNDVVNMPIRITGIEKSSFDVNQNMICDGYEIQSDTKLQFTVYHRQTRKFLEMVGQKRRFPIDVVLLSEMTNQGIMLRSVTIEDLKD